jgi:integral membrane protein
VSNPSTPQGRAIYMFRISGIVEAISFMLLVGIAMPLKYLADMPMAVRVVGMIHGILFIIYCVALVNVRLKVKWPAGRVFGYFLIALIPFGPFLVDGKLRKEQASFGGI